VMFPIAVINPVVPKLATFAFPVALSVTLNTPALAFKLATFALPLTDNLPEVVKLPPVMFPVAVISPVVPKLPTLALPITLNIPNEYKLPAVELAVTVS